MIARSGFGTTRLRIISGSKRSPHSLREARFFCSVRQAANNIKTVSCKTYYHAEGLLYTGSYDRTVKGITAPR
ncbi:hypothetical protein GQ457_08G003920 [Hibiscus cannabinus]